MEKEKEELFNRIEEALAIYHKNSPCYSCGPGNGCDDCRGCKDGELDSKLYKEVSRLKDEYRAKFGVDFNEDARARDREYQKMRRKQALLKEVWETCTFEEIIAAGPGCDDSVKVSILEIV